MPEAEFWGNIWEKTISCFKVTFITLNFNLTFKWFNFFLSTLHLTLSIFLLEFWPLDFIKSEQLGSYSTFHSKKALTRNAMMLDEGQTKMSALHGLRLTLRKELAQFQYFAKFLEFSEFSRIFSVFAKMLKLREKWNHQNLREIVKSRGKFVPFVEKKWGYTVCCCMLCGCVFWVCILGVSISCSISGLQNERTVPWIIWTKRNKVITKLMTQTQFRVHIVKSQCQHWMSESSGVQALSFIRFCFHGFGCFLLKRGVSVWKLPSACIS